MSFGRCVTPACPHCRPTWTFQVILSTLCVKSVANYWWLNAPARPNAVYKRTRLVLCACLLYISLFLFIMHQMLGLWVEIFRGKMKKEITLQGLACCCPHYFLCRFWFLFFPLAYLCLDTVHVGCEGEVLFLKPKNIGRFLLSLLLPWSRFTRSWWFTCKCMKQQRLEVFLVSVTDVQCSLQGPEMNFILLLNIKNMALWRKRSASWMA